MNTFLAPLLLLHAAVHVVCTTERPDDFCGGEDIVVPAYTNNKVTFQRFLEEEEKKNAPNTFSDAENAASTGESTGFWDKLYHKFFGKGPAGEPCAKPAEKQPPTYAKCDRSTGYDVVCDRFNAQLVRKAKAKNFPPGYEKCCEIRARREIRDLSDQELADLMHAMQSLTTKKTPDGKLTVYNQLADMVTVGRRLRIVHGTAAFLPWQRLLLYRLESELRAMNPAIALPYWDWSIASQAPETVPIFSSDHFGSHADDNAAVYGSLLRGFDVRRAWQDGKVPALPSADVLRALISYCSSFQDLSTRLEVLQGMVQISIGGISQPTKAGKPVAPAGTLAGDRCAYDPIFWFVAAFTDKLWALATQKRGDCIGIANDVPLWGFRRSAKQVEFLSQLCYLYRPSMYLKKVFSDSSRGIISGLRPKCPTSSLPKCPAGLVPKCQVRPAPCATAAAMQQKIVIVKSSPADSSNHAAKFQIPTSTKDLNRLYDEISKRFTIKRLIISAYNRNPDSRLIRLPRPLPCFYIDMNRLDSQSVHQIEAQLIKMIIVLNASIMAGRFKPLMAN